MLERHLLLNAAAAILMACLAWQHPDMARRWGRGGLVLFVAGALLPFVDTALFHLITADRIELLSRAPLFAAPLYGLALIGVLALLTACVTRPARGRQVALGLAAGLGAHIALAVITPTGWPLLAPLSAHRLAMPVLPTGHLTLLVLLFPLVVAAEALPRWRRWICNSAAALAVVYLLIGAVPWAALTVRTQAMAGPGERVRVYPDGAWPGGWQVIVEGPDGYALQRRHIYGPPPPEPQVFPRWNDEALFLKLLGDPVVNRFYYRVFQHPVVRLDISGAQITLLMQELAHQSPPVPGPTFYVESDPTGRKRFYQLQRFN